jgi:O-antigen/teichoic acid export membrane protein
MVNSKTVPTNYKEQFRRLTRRDGYAAELVFFAISTAAFQFSRLIVSLIVARWVGPEEFGVWNALNLLLLYGVLVLLGVPNGMNRDVPIHRGRGDTQTVTKIFQTSLWMVLLVNIVVGGVISTISIWQPTSYQMSLVWMGALFISWQLYQYLQLSLKAQGLFHKMSQQQLIFAFLSPCIILPLAYIWRVPGFILGQTIVTVLLCVIIIRMGSLPLTFSWDWSIVKQLISSGWPIMLVGLVYSLLTTVDRWIIGTFIGLEALGYYTLPILCLSVLQLLPSVISQQMYPRMAYQYGKTGLKRALIPLIKRQTLLSVSITWPILLAVYWLLPWIIPMAMPEYSPGIKPAQYLLIGLAMMPFSSGIGNFLNTVGKQRHYLTVQVAALISSVVLNTTFVRLGWGIIGVSFGSALAFAFYACALATVGWFVLQND